MMSTDRSSSATGPANEEGPKKRLRWRLLATAAVNLPRGLLAGTLAALILTWGMFALNPGAWPGLVSPIAQSAVYLALVVVTARSRRVKVLIVRTFQRWTVNPLMRVLLRVGVNPLGLAILETRGRAFPVSHGAPRSATGERAAPSGSSPSTGPVPGTCATSDGTRGSGCDYEAGGGIAGCPESPRSCPTTTRSPANAASSAGIPCARSTRSTCACSAPTCSACG